MATMQEVASRAGVGIGTVSRVLNDSPQVHPDTRARVLRAIDELGFVPSTSGRRLKLGQTLLAGVVAPFVTVPSFVERLRGIEHVLASSRYDLVVFNVEAPDRRDQLLREVPHRERVDGLIVVSLTPRAEEISRIVHSGLRAVLLDAQHRNLDSVVFDNVAAGRMAGHHLLDLGHRRLAYIGDRPVRGFGFHSSRDRLNGLKEALRAGGLEILDERVEWVPDAPRHGAEAAKRLASLADPPTAIFCSGDVLAMGALEGLRTIGLDVPGDVSVVGHDDIELAGHLSLTTVHQPLFESGTRAAELLLAGMREPARPVQRIDLPMEMVVRATTASPRRR
jgi:DNA-binding LacI/PurR family transcriptional regulator